MSPEFKAEAIKASQQTDVSMEWISDRPLGS